MLDRDGIAGLIPHQGAMCLLERVVAWDAATILCRTSTHLDPANPLCRAGRLGGLAGIEYALQAAALHGALRRRATPPGPGYLAALRDVSLAAGRLDAPENGILSVSARLELAQPEGLIYAFAVEAEDGRRLVAGRAVIVLGR